MDKASHFFYLLSIERQAAKRVYKKFGINRYELNALAGLAGCMLKLNRQVISREVFFDWLGGNSRFSAKVFGYIMGLINKGCLHRCTWRNRRVESGQTLAISSYGFRVLDFFYEEVEKIEVETLPHYRSLEIHSDNLPKGYTLRQAGRND